MSASNLNEIIIYFVYKVLNLENQFKKNVSITIYF